jgi:hypothetical protein
MHSWEGYKKFAWGTDELMPQVFTSVLSSLLLLLLWLFISIAIIIMIILMKIIIITGAHGAQLAGARRHYRRLDEHTGESLSLSLFIFVIIIAITSSISIMMNSNVVKSRRILTFENVCLQNGNHGRMCSLKAVFSNTVFSTQLF